MNDHILVPPIPINLETRAQGINIFNKYFPQLLKGCLVKKSSINIRADLCIFRLSKSKIQIQMFLGLSTLIYHSICIV